MIHIHDRPALLSDDLNRYRPRSGADFAHKTRCHKPTISTRHPILSNHSRPPETLKPQVTRLRNNPKQGSDQTQVNARAFARQVHESVFFDRTGAVGDFLGTFDLLVQSAVITFLAFERVMVNNPAFARVAARTHDPR